MKTSNAFGSKEPPVIDVSEDASGLYVPEGKKTLKDFQELNYRLGELFAFTTDKDRNVIGAIYSLSMAAIGAHVNHPFDVHVGGPEKVEVDYLIEKQEEVAYHWTEESDLLRLTLTLYFGGRILGSSEPWSKARGQKFTLTSYAGGRFYSKKIKATDKNYFKNIPILNKEVVGYEKGQELTREKIKEYLSRV